MFQTLQQLLPVAQRESNNVSDTSDDPTTAAANDPMVTTITGSPSIEVTETATVNDTNSNGKNDQGDIITYSIKVENKVEISHSPD